jgi:hypothetical protein
MKVGGVRARGILTETRIETVRKTGICETRKKKNECEGYSSEDGCSDAEDRSNQSERAFISASERCERLSDVY